MAENKQITQYIHKSKVFSIPQLQAELQISYYEAKRAVDKLTADGKISKVDGLFYRYDQPDRVFDKARCDETVQDKYVKILKYCIEKETVTLFQVAHEFPVGLITVNSAMEWMGRSGYLSPVLDGGKRKALITMEQFNEIFGSKKEDEEQTVKTQGEADKGVKSEVTKKDDAKAVAAEKHFCLNYLSSLKFAFKLTDIGGANFIVAEGVNFKTGHGVKFRVGVGQNGSALSDNGYCFNYLSECLGKARAESKIKRYLSGKKVKYEGGELSVETTITTALSDFLCLYNVVEGLL